MMIDEQWVREQFSERMGEVVHAGVLGEVLQALDDEDGDFSGIAEALQNDPYLSSRVLAMANLVPIAGEPVETLDRAVQLLGVRQVHALTIAAMMLAVARTALPPTDRQDMWRWVFGCAVASGWLESRIRGGSGASFGHEAGGVVGAMGLLMGVVIFRAGLGEQYAEVMGQPPAPVALAEREQETFGATHYDVSSMAMEILQCPAFMLRYPAALSGRTDEQALMVGRSVELFGSLLAGLDAEQSEAWLIEGLPRLGIDGFDAIEAAPELREQASGLTRRLGIEAGRWPVDQESLMVAGGAMIQNMLVDQLTVGQSLRLSAAEIADSFEARHEAATDPLTGLLNRRGLTSQLGEALADVQGSVGLLVIDVDGFKRVNDALGHGIGDEVLQRVAHALGSVQPEALLLGRVGGDEFVAVVPTGDDELLLWEWCESLRVTFRTAMAGVSTEAAGLTPTLSIGALVLPAPTLKVAWQLACDRADELMYEAKRGGGDQASISAVFEDEDAEG